MTDKVGSKNREREAAVPTHPALRVRYERNKFAEQQMTGKVVIRDSDREWRTTEQSPKVKWYLQPHTFTDHALRDWYVFSHDVQKQSGKHKHQGGGVSIFVLKGKGYTIVEGKRYDWEEGDLILLPHKPGGVEHQHFNLEPEKECKWIAFIYLPYHNMLASVTTQIERFPEYKPEVT
ncbi:cupin domain-containing protein [Thermodesulfobacteriota bacterium]